MDISTVTKFKYISCVSSKLIDIDIDILIFGYEICTYVNGFGFLMQILLMMVSFAVPIVFYSA